MENQADVLAALAMPMQRQAHVAQHGVGAALGDGIDCGAQVDDAWDWPDGDAVVHGHDDGAARIAVDEAFQADSLAENHGLSLLSPWVSPITRCVSLLMSKQKSLSW